MEPGRGVGVIRGNSVEEVVHRINQQLLYKAKRINTTLRIDEALGLLMYVSFSTLIFFSQTEIFDEKC